MEIHRPKCVGITVIVNSVKKKQKKKHMCYNCYKYDISDIMLFWLHQHKHSSSGDIKHKITLTDRILKSFGFGPKQTSMHMPTDSYKNRSKRSLFAWPLWAAQKHKRHSIWSSSPPCWESASPLPLSVLVTVKLHWNTHLYRNSISTQTSYTFYIHTHF